MKLRDMPLQNVWRGDTSTDPIGSKFQPQTYGSQAYVGVHTRYPRPLITMDENALHRTGVDLMNDEVTGWLNLIEEF